MGIWESSLGLKDFVFTNNIEIDGEEMAVQAVLIQPFECSNE